ncbi:DNA polymerase delta catalytic subunit [Citrus sinensis]|nr:DNA polymerase delta catalytic subunit [Citrus sinensis]
MVLKTGGNVSRHLPKSLQFQCFTRQTVSPSQQMNRSNGSARKRPPPTPKESWPNKQQATTPTTPVIDDEFLDEDVFLDETLLPEDEESLILRDIEQRQDFASRLAKWARPPLSSGYVSQCQSIMFQQLDIDYVIGDSNRELLPLSSGSAAIIRIFGVTREGHSVCCKVHGFEPYFYISCPQGMGPDDISHFHQILEVFSLPIRSRILDRGIQLDGLGMKSFMTYESNVLFALRFMIDCNIVGGNWIEVPVGKYRKTAKTLSYCQLEFDCLYPFAWRYSDIISHHPEGEFSKMAPFRILSFDIECAGRKGHFPEPTHDPVIQVANLVTLQGEKQPFIRNVMTLKSCAPIVGVDVMSFETERDVLLAWRDFIREVDPDVMIGYNICKFDLPYLIERSQTLGIAEFPILGRIRNSRVRVKDTTFSSRQLGTRESKEVTVEGRVQFDLLQVMQRDYKLSSYSLNSVSAHFLSEQKEDVHHSIISDLQNGNAETRRRLAVYCLKDAYLPQRLLDKLMFIFNYVEMARVTGVPISFLLSRGQSIKVLSQLLRKAKQKNLVIPNVKQAGSEQGTYEGATVLEARAGFYEKPIATLDFASLYPSIMMAYNLCYSTLVTPEDARKLNLPPECVNKTPSGETFVKSNLQKGILPEILEELLAARKRAKADLKEAKDPLEKAVLDGRQLALKISANSVYGFTGATVGQLPCIEISSSVTSYGRQMIEHTKKLVEDKFTTVGGYEHNAEVIYGDTDSVMVQFGVPTVEAAMKLGREAADYISGTFIKGLTKTGDDYEVKAAHVELAERMRKRDAATAPNVGDRVPYVIIKAAKGAKAYERSEDPIYVLENNIPIDTHYYLENQISKPLLRIFEPILKNASKELLSGDHTRSISISTPSNSGIMKFAKRQLSCIGCKALISNGTLCSHCKGREAELYCKTVSQVQELEVLFGRLWTQCQECQGSLHQDVLCTSRDCPIFYRRKKAQKDMAEAKLQLDRWNF